MAKALANAVLLEAVYAMLEEMGIAREVSSRTVHKVNIEIGAGMIPKITVQFWANGNDTIVRIVESIEEADVVDHVVG